MVHLTAEYAERSEAKLFAESACALGETFLIKRPFSLRQSIRSGAYNSHYGHIKEKEEFYSKVGCTKAAASSQSSGGEIQAEKTGT
jgi:hypothetical protein